MHHFAPYGPVFPAQTESVTPVTLGPGDDPGGAPVRPGCGKGRGRQEIFMGPCPITRQEPSSQRSS